MLVRQMAICALGEIGDARATERLRRALQDSRPEVRFQAVMAFPRVTASLEDATHALLAATRDKDPLVCHIALRMAEEVAGRWRALTSNGFGRISRARPGATRARGSRGTRNKRSILLAREREPRALALIVNVVVGTVRSTDREDEAAAIELGWGSSCCARRGLALSAGRLEGFSASAATRSHFTLVWRWHEWGTTVLVETSCAALGSVNRDRCALAVAAAGRARLLSAEPTLVALRDGLRVTSVRWTRHSRCWQAHGPSCRETSTMIEERFSARDLALSGEATRLARREGVDRIATSIAVLAARVWIGGMVGLAPVQPRSSFASRRRRFLGMQWVQRFPVSTRWLSGCAVCLLGAEVVRTWASGRQGVRPLSRARRLIAVALAIGATYGGLALTPRIIGLHQAGAHRGVGLLGDELARAHGRAELLAKVETALAVVR